MENLIKPISPDDIMDNLEKIIPPVVIKVINELLKNSYRGGEVSIKQDDIVNAILKSDPNLTRDVIFDKKYLDFEKIYRDNGWVVVYDKPSYRDDYPATFKFTKRK